MSEQLKHTPGPWVFHTPDNSGWIDIVKIEKDRDGDPVMSLPFAACKHFDQEANARLIASAPEMLNLLHEALDFIEDYEDVIDGDAGRPAANRAMHVATPLRDGIAKATGEANV